VVTLLAMFFINKDWYPVSERFVDRTLANAFPDEGPHAQQVKRGGNVLDVSCPDVLGEGDTESKAVLAEALLGVVAHKFLLDDFFLIFFEDESFLLVGGEWRPRTKGSVLAAAAAVVVGCLYGLTAILGPDGRAFLKQECLQLNQDGLSRVGRAPSHVAFLFFTRLKHIQANGVAKYIRML